MSSVAPRHLASRAPPAAWEAYLVIGVFPAGERLRWCKAHVFVGSARPGWRCLSAVEALDGPGEAAFLTGDERGVTRHTWALDGSTCARDRNGWRIEAPLLRWAGWPRTHVAIDEPRVELGATVRDVGWWARIPRVLSYFTGFGDLSLRRAGDASAIRGVGLVEHAWGADVPFDPASLGPRRWQWDVLTCSEGGVAGALTIAGLGVRTMGRLRPGEPFATGWRARVRVREWREEVGRRAPLRWEGTMSIGAGTLRYEARAATPVSAVVPGGGFLGTSWEGEWAGSSVSGTGFTEYRASS